MKRLITGLMAGIVVIAVVGGNASAQPQTAEPGSVHISHGQVLWMGLAEGMTPDEAQAAVEAVRGVKKVSVRRRTVRIDERFEGFLLQGSTDLLDIDQFLDPAKAVTVLDTPTAFRTIFDQRGRLYSLILTPAPPPLQHLRDLGGAAGLGCKGYLAADSHRAVETWEAALQAKYPEVIDLGSAWRAFTDGNVVVQIVPTRTFAATRMTAQERKANPFMVQNEMFKCFVDTVNVNLLYMSASSFDAVRSEKGDASKRLQDNFTQRAKNEL